MSRLARAAPYAALLAVAAWLYSVAARIEYAGSQDRLGPDFWPKAVLVLLGLLCAYEIAKNLFFRGPAAVSGVLQSLLERSEGSVPPDAPSARPASWGRLGAGLGATVAYVLLVDSLGFFVATAAFLCGFILIGGYRRWAIALAAGLAGSFAMVAIFMKLVYVSLPLGAGPFRALSLLLLVALGVR